MYKVNSKVEVIEVGDESYLLTDDCGNIHSINSTTKQIYDFCVKGLSCEEICKEINKLYMIDDKAREAIEMCINSLIELDIIYLKER